MRNTRLCYALFSLCALASAGCNRAEPLVNKDRPTPPPEIQDLRKNPNVPPGQADYLMSKGQSAPPGTKQ